MVEKSTMNLLFFLGVLIPALVTIGLFFVFCYCWHKMRIRNEILYKKHDPHKIEKLREHGAIYEPPPPPPPPFKQTDMVFLSPSLNHNNNNNNKNKPSSDNYEESPEPTEGIDNPAMYRTNADSGFSDLNQIQCNVDTTAHAMVQRHESEGLRPNSQASDDSDDSGFRSSRSGQYIHSASSSTGGNAQESVFSCQTNDVVPLFKPIKIHPNELGQPLVSYVHRSSSKRKSHKQRKPIPSSQHYNLQQAESQQIDFSHPLVQLGQVQNGPKSHYSPAYTVGYSPAYTVGYSAGSPGRQTQQISKSCNDVHGGRLHSIDTHSFPLTSIGTFGLTSCTNSCTTHQNTDNNYSEGHFSQPNSIGYGSLTTPPVHSFNGYGGGTVCSTGQINMDPMNHFPANNRITLSNKAPLSGQHHIPGYTISQFSHIRPIQPDLGITQKCKDPLSLEPVSDIPMQLNITQAMVHRPFSETLSGDASLFSVV